MKPVAMQGLRGDLVTLPCIYNKWASPPDPAPVVPAGLAHERLVGEEVVPKQEWMDEAMKLSHRSTTPSEDK